MVRLLGVSSLRVGLSFGILLAMFLAFFSLGGGIVFDVDSRSVSRRAAIGFAAGAVAALAIGLPIALAGDEGDGSDSGEGGSGSVGVSDIFHDVVWYDPNPSNPPQGWNNDSTEWWFSLMTGGKQNVYSPSFSSVARTGQGFGYDWNEAMFRETCAGALAAARASFWSRADDVQRAKWGSESAVNARIVAAALFSAIDRNASDTRPCNYSWQGLHIADNWNESYDTSQIPSGTAEYFHPTKSQHTLDPEGWNKPCRYDESRSWYQFVRDNALSASDGGKVWVCIIAVCEGEPVGYGYAYVKKESSV
jgi:hypothetical protein